IRLKKDYAGAHLNLGTILIGKGCLDEAIAAYRAAIQLKQDDEVAHNNLGFALRDKGCLDEAIAEHCEAIRLKKDSAEAHMGLGLTLQAQGEFAKALEALRRGHQLGSRDPRWPHPTAQLVGRCERLVELDRRLPGLLEGKTTPAGPSERIELAELCA